MPVPGKQETPQQVHRTPSLKQNFSRYPVFLLVNITVVVVYRTQSNGLLTIWHRDTGCYSSSSSFSLYDFWGRVCPTALRYIITRCSNLSFLLRFFSRVPQFLDWVAVSYERTTVWYSIFIKLSNKGGCKDAVFRITFDDGGGVGKFL